MSHIYEELKQDLDQVSGEGPWHATVATEPADLDEMIYVVIPEFSPQLRWGPCRWQARSDTALPSRGDDALVIRSNRGEWWVVSWWPFNG